MRIVLTIAAALFVLLLAAPASADWDPDCRGYTAARTVRCIASRQVPPGGVSKALSVWRCESGWGYEPGHSDSYHGPFQYLPSTYSGQRARMPRMTEWFRLSTNVHDMRSNIIMAVAWAKRHDWLPWARCA